MKKLVLVGMIFFAYELANLYTLKACQEEKAQERRQKRLRGANGPKPQSGQPNNPSGPLPTSSK